MSIFCCERDDVNPAYVLIGANPDIPQDVLTHVLSHYQMSPRQTMAHDHKKAVCSSILNMIRNILRNKNRCAMPGLLWIEQRERWGMFLSHIKKKIKSMRNNNTKLETIISLLNPGNIKWEMNRFNKNDVKGRYNLSYSFISRKLKQNTHLIHRY